MAQEIKIGNTIKAADIIYRSAMPQEYKIIAVAEQDFEPCEDDDPESYLNGFAWALDKEGNLCAIVRFSDSDIWYFDDTAFEWSDDDDQQIPFYEELTEQGYEVYLDKNTNKYKVNNIK